MPEWIAPEMMLTEPIANHNDQRKSQRNALEQRRAVFFEYRKTLITLHRSGDRHSSFSQ
jgi:hypothetical protein